MPDQLTVTAQVTRRDRVAITVDNAKDGEQYERYARAVARLALDLGEGVVVSVTRAANEKPS